MWLLLRLNMHHTEQHKSDCLFQGIINVGLGIIPCEFVRASHLLKESLNFLTTKGNNTFNMLLLNLLLEIAINVARTHFHHLVEAN